jgi:hypothetical protein
LGVRRFMTVNGKMKVGSSSAGWSRAKLRVWGRWGPSLVQRMQ